MPRENDNVVDKPDKEKKPKKKKEGRIKLEKGTPIACGSTLYKVETLLGSGGFGDVYQVYPRNAPDKKYAMKTEYIPKGKDAKNKLLNRLKVETNVFDDIKKCSSPIDKSHFVHYIDKGKSNAFKFIVMEIVWHSLIDIRNNMMKNYVSESTIMQIARQTLQAIEALHVIGYVHRDIKPHNFAIGRPPKESKIYILDFGIARKFIDSENRIRVPRKNVRFLGTVKYASRACHNEQEQCRRDDIEVWMYMILEYFNKENLRWRREIDKTKIVAIKTEVMTKFRTLEPALLVPKRFLRILEMIESLTYTCAPDYNAIHGALTGVCKDENIDETLPLDWIGKLTDMKKTKKHKKADEKLLNEEDSGEMKKWDERAKKKMTQKLKLEEELTRLYKEMGATQTPEQIKAEIRKKMRRTREEEKRRKRAERRDDDDYEDEESESSEDDYSDEDDEPRRRSKMLSVMKMIRDDKGDSKIRKVESRKKRTNKRNSREDVEIEDDRRHSGNRKKGSRNAKSAYGNMGSRMEKMESQKKRKSMSRMGKPVDSPPHKSASVKQNDPDMCHNVNDYIVLKTVNDLEKDEDEKDEKDRKRREKEKSSHMDEITGKVTDHDKK